MSADTADHDVGSRQSGRHADLAARAVSLALGLPGLIAPLLATIDPGRASWRFGASIPILALATWIAARRFGSRLPGPFILLSTLALGILWPETGLRIAGYRFHPAGVIQFGYPNPTEMIGLDPDPVLFWRLPPSIPFVNRLGFLGPVPVQPKPAGSYRIFYFGDSCTQQGHPQGYPELAAGLLERHARRPYRFEAVNLGVSGYSSYQGRQLALEFVDRFEPDAAVVHYGWNDHWRAYGATDEERGVRSGGHGEDLFLSAMTRSRLLQWIVAQGKRFAGRPLDRQRVAPEEFMANLERIGDLVEGAGGTVVLVTAPSSYKRLGVPDYVVDRGFAPSAEEAIEIHDRYAGIVRELAHRREWVLVDLARDAEAEPDIGSLFMEDGIHFTPLGMHWVAARIARAIDRGL